MANKTNRKLSLKKETLRQINDSQLAGVGGGTEYLTKVSPPITGTCTCETMLCPNLIYLNFNIKYY